MKNWSTHIEKQPTPIMTSTLTLQNLKIEEQDKQCIDKIDIIKTSSLTDVPFFRINIYPVNKDYVYSGSLELLSPLNYGPNKMVLRSTALSDLQLSTLDGISDLPFDEETKNIINNFFEFSPQVAQMYKAKLDKAYTMMKSNLMNEQTCDKISEILKVDDCKAAASLSELFFHHEINQLKLSVDDMRNSQSFKIK